MIQKFSHKFKSEFLIQSTRHQIIYLRSVTQKVKPTVHDSFLKLSFCPTTPQKQPMIQR